MRVQVVSFHCVLKNNLGDFISSSFNQNVVTTPTMNETEMLPDFVNALRLLKNGERKKINVSAEKAYGLYQPELMVTMRRRELPYQTPLRVGKILRFRLPHDEVSRTYRVVAFNDLEVTLDANHELAGQDLVFDVEMVSSHEENEAPDLRAPSLH